MTIEENVSLAPLTTFHIGGKARHFARAASVEELKEALEFARARDLKIFYLGGGSNVLFADAGFDGLVVKIEVAGIERRGDEYVAGAGEPWDALCARAAADGLWGIENLSGIPGTLGGACVQNIGAYGAALSSVIEWVEVWDRAKNATRRLTREECSFGYRDSAFKHNDSIVLRAALKLSPSARPNLSYKDLAERFSGKEPSLIEVRSAVVDIRSRKFPDLAREGTAGSFFLNPVLPRAQALALQGRFPGMPLFDMPETDRVKVPLAWLLDRALKLRGHAEGGARLFERQPLVIAALPGTRAAEVRALSDRVKKEAQEKLGLRVEEEVRVL